MINAFREIINYEEDSWGEFLESICLLEIFMPVIKEYKNVDTLKCVIRYIVYTYSKDSDKVVIGMEWQKNKQKIFEFVLAKPERDIYEDLVLLKKDAVVLSIHNWLESQDGDTHKQLSVLRDLRVEMQLSANSKILKSSGEYDYDQKFKNAEYANKLKGMIKDLESELMQNSQEFKEAVKEIKKVKKNVNTVGVENFAK